MGLVIKAENVLWKSRGLYWDYEFVCKPVLPRLAAWQNVLETILGQEEPDHSILHAGVLEIDGSSHEYVATRFLDPVRTDETKRPIQHFLIWFVPGETPSDLPSTIPVDWHLNWLKGAQSTYGSDKVYGLDRDTVRRWRELNPKESQGQRFQQAVASTRVELPEGSCDQSRWRRDPTVKKKIELTAPPNNLQFWGKLRAAWLVVPLLILAATILFWYWGSRSHGSPSRPLPPPSQGVK